MGFFNKNVFKGLQDTIKGSLTSKMNLKTAQTISAVYQAIRIVSQDAASLPLNAYRKENNTISYFENEITKQLATVPDSFLNVTLYKFIETFVKDAMLYGNGFGLIHMNSFRVEYIKPSIVSILQNNSTGEVFYKIEKKAGPLPGGLFSSDQIVHLKNQSENPIVGESCLFHGAESIGIILSQRQLQSKFYESGTIIRDYLSTPHSISDKAYERLKGNFTLLYTGIDTAFNTPILEDGLTYHTVNIRMQDISLLDSHKVGVAEIARWFNVPLDMLFEYDSRPPDRKYYIFHSLLPWVERIEQEFTIKLLNPKNGEYFKFDLSQIMRGTISETANMYTKLINAGIYTQNEARKELNFKANKDANQLLFPLNSIPHEMAKDYYEAIIKNKTFNTENQAENKE